MKNLKAKLRRDGGFTLVEMLIVVAIIAILVAVSIPMVSSSLEKAREAVDRANARDAISLASIEVLTADPAKPVPSGTKWAYVVTGNTGSLGAEGSGYEGVSAGVKDEELIVTYTVGTKGEQSFTTTFDGKIGVATAP